VETLPLDVLIGPALVLDLTTAERLDAPMFDGVDLRERVLLKTRNSNSNLWERDTFAEEFISLTEDGAQRLIDGGVRLVGIDYLSIGDEAAHTALLGAGVVALEGLDLRQVEPGEYQLVCAPLKLVGSDGAPARTLLIRD
jgi:arylformamidase